MQKYLQLTSCTLHIFWSRQMNTITAAINAETGMFRNHEPLEFSPYMVMAMNDLHDDHTTLEHLLNIKNLNIAQNVMKYLGKSLREELKGITPGIRLVELLCDSKDIEFSNTYGAISVFTPAEFWNNATKIIERERVLVDQKDSILGEDTFGVIFVVEKVTEGARKKILVNIYREHWRGKIEYHMRLFPEFGMSECGHYFAIKMSR